MHSEITSVAAPMRTAKAKPMPAKKRNISVKRVLPVAKNTDTMPTNDNPAADPRTMLTVSNGLHVVADNNGDLSTVPVPALTVTSSDDGTVHALGSGDPAIISGFVNMLAEIDRETPDETSTSEPVSENVSDNVQADLSEKHLARLAAKAAVSAFYSGTSLPFKAACDLKYRAAVHPRGAAQTARTAGLIAAIITYCDIQPDYTFKRGSGAVPGRLLGYTGADAERIFNAGPESGALGRLIGDARITHVSGTLHGNGAENAVYKIDPVKCRANLTTFNNKLDNGSRVFSAPLRLLRVLEKANAEHVPFTPETPDITASDIGL
jgi:hypothetical protein